MDHNAVPVVVGFQAVFALLLLIQVSMLPDSPRWCMAHGMKEEAVCILAQLEDKASPDHPDVVLKTKEIEASLALESAGGKRVLISDNEEAHSLTFF